MRKEMVLFATILGIIGVIIINIAYLLLNSGRLRPDHVAYPLSNFIGASFIIFSLTLEWNLSAFLMESSWAAISFYGFIKARRRAPGITP